MMNPTILGAAITASLRELYSYDYTGAQLGNPEYFLQQFGLKLATDIINHIQTYANCDGFDVPQGNTHFGVKVE